MLQFIGGAGLFYIIITIIVTIYVGVAIFETSLEKKAGQKNVVISILQVIGCAIFITLLSGLFGWLIIDTMWLLLIRNICN